MQIEFEVRGRPVPKGRPRIVRNNEGRSTAFTPERTRLYETKIKGLALVARQEARAKMFAGAVGVKVIVRPQSATIRVYDLPISPDATHLPMPGDLDNILKTVLDALNGILYRDDRQVEKITVEFHESTF